MKDNQQLEKLQYLSSNLNELIDNLDEVVQVINNEMQGCKDNQQLKNLRDISNNVHKLSSNLNGAVKAINTSTELKRIMLEMIKDNQEMKEKMKAYRND